MQSFVKLFADDTKLFKCVRSILDWNRIQTDLSMLDDWSSKWLLRFNAAKCKHMQVGNVPMDTSYKMLDSSRPGDNIYLTLERIHLEKDLGVWTDDSLSFLQHIDRAVKKGNSILGIIRRTFTHLTKDILLCLYKTLVRPHLEYGNIIWHPYRVKDIVAVEGVQRRATAMVPELAKLQYPDRLRALKLPTLVYRRQRGDMIEVYKVVTGKYDICPDNLFTRSTNTRTRGHSLTLDRRWAENSIRKNFFTVRTIKDWNSLPESVVSAPTTNAFKGRLDRYWQSHPNRFEYRAIIPQAAQHRRNIFVATGTQDL